MSEYIVRESGYPGTISYLTVGELVRCKECVHYWKNNLKAEVDDAVAVCLASPKDDAFCSEGERREDAEIH